MLTIVKASDPLVVERINLCVYSPPGLGKTTLGFTAEDPLMIDCDKGAYRAANRKDTVQVSSWSDVAAISVDDLTRYKTVVVDTAGRALDLLTGDIIANNPKMGRGGALTLQGYGELKAKFTAWLKMLRLCGKDVVLIAHMDEQRNGDDVLERLDVQGGSKAEIYKSVDAMGRLYIRNGSRFLDFNPRDNSFGKNPCGLPVMPFEVGNTHFLADIISTIKDRLNASVDAEKDEQRKITDWQTVIGECTTADSLNMILKEVRAAGPKIIAIANKRVRELGLKYDKATESVYELPKEVASAGGKR